MKIEHYWYLLAFLLWLPAAIQGSVALWGGVRFLRYVRAAIRNAPRLRAANGKFLFQPKAVVILPCCGVDDRLELTVQALAQQDYDDYEVIFTFESEDDPAYQAIRRWTRDWRHPRTRFVTSGRATQRSQKIHNLLAALETASPDRELFIFLDSDAVPGIDWLGQMAAPLASPGVGATTGYRWYSSRGGLAAGLRCSWNAATVTLLDDEHTNFCWGGATAMMRSTFDKLEIRRHWDRSLTDDYPVTLAVRRAGLRIHFVPRALVPSADETTLRNFWIFARRQLVITRIYVPAIWWAGFTLCLNFVVGGTAAAVLCLASWFGWIGNPIITATALAGWLFLILLGTGKALLRQLAVRKLLAPPDWTWRDFWWDAGGVSLSGLLHLALLLSSLSSRRFVWRNTRYELVSPVEMRILGRADDPKP